VKSLRVIPQTLYFCFVCSIIYIFYETQHYWRFNLLEFISCSPMRTRSSAIATRDRTTCYVSWGMGVSSIATMSLFHRFRDIITYFPKRSRDWTHRFWGKI